MPVFEDRLDVAYTNSAGVTSKGHIFAGGLDTTKPIGILVYTDGSAEYGLKNPTSSYLLTGPNGLVAVAKKHNLLLVTPLAPGDGCTDGDGTCWYLPSNNGLNIASKIKWADDFIRTQVLAQYTIDTSRTVIAGYSSGAQFTTEYYGPQYAHQWMTDGLLLAISYGGSPKVASTYPNAFKEAVPAVWDVGSADEAYTRTDAYGVQAGYDWYRSNGFAITELNLVQGLGHDRSGQFGTILDREITQHVSSSLPPSPPPAIPVTGYEEERLARVERLLGMGEYTPDDPGGISVPDPSAMTRPMYVRARENNDRSVSLFWSGASPVYEVHEFLADPSATLKATVTVGTRTSGPLVNGNTYEYAVRGVVGSAYTEFSERVRITIGQAPSSSPGGTGGWVDPGAEPTDPDEQPPPPPPDPVVDLTTAAGRNGWGVPKWTEEFNYNGPPDPLKWSVYDGDGHAGNGIRSPSRVTVDGTKMIMTGLNGTGNTAGMMHKAKEVYGRYEWRARSFYTGDPTAPGNKSGGYHPVALVWPSKPYKPGTTTVVSWPYGGEYDPMENGEPGMQTAGCFHHYPSLDGQNHQIEAPDFPADMREWNNFAFEWTSQHLKGWVNGELWYTMSGGAAADRKAIQMMEEGRFCFQLDAFDSGSGNIASTMEVDWLRFYPLIPIQPDPGTGTPPPPTGTNTSPWVNAHLDGVSYPVITGGGTGTAQSLTSLGSAASNNVYNYTGPTLTGATSVDFTGKSNITIKGIKMADPAKLTPKAGTNIILEVEAPYELQNGGETVKWVGVYNRCLITNSLFGPSTTDTSPTTVKNRYVQFGDSTSVGATHGRLTRSTLRNKNGPGNPVHAVGDTANATGGVRYTIVAFNLFQGVKPFDENDHESALMGISTLQLTNGQQIVEFNRFEDCRSEPEVISMKMNWSAIRGNTFHNCVGSLSLRHGDDGVICHNWVYGFEEETGTGSYNRTSAGPRIYGARHKVFNNTIQVNGNGGSRPSATSLFESPLTLDTGDVAPGSTSNAHANIVACMVERNLLVKCGNPICAVDNYSTAPQGTVRDNWIVECANAGTDGVRAFGTGTKTNLNITGNSVYSTVANAGLTAGQGGHYLPPAGMDRGSKAPYLTAAMVGRGSTYDPYGGTTTPTTPNPTEPPPPVSSAQYPADILNLTPWKITLPVIQDGKVKEVKQPELARFTDKHFLVNTAKDGVLFRVWHGGGTTSNSSNPRSELREMNSSGSTEYNWNGTSGTHTQTVVGMVSRLTKVKPHVVLWQIHGGDDDTTVFRLEGSSLWITNGDTTHAKLITSSFQLNQRYTLKGEVRNGVCSYWYNGVKIDYTLNISDTSCYFKAGNYLQSNPTSAPGESTSEYSEVTIYSVSVTHS